MGGIGLDPVGQPLAAEIGHVDAAARRIIGPAMIAAAHRATLDHAMAERDLAMRAAILQREDLTLGAPDDHHRLADDAPGEHLAGLELAAPGDGVPMVGMGADLAQIARGRELNVLNIDRFQHVPAPPLARNAASACHAVPSTM